MSMITCRDVHGVWVGVTEVTGPDGARVVPLFWD
jgi:hypothetical protein